MSAIENADKLQELSYVDLRHLVEDLQNSKHELKKKESRETQRATYAVGD